VASVVGDSEGVAIYAGNLAALALDRKEWAKADSLRTGDQGGIPTPERHCH
jgi:hypothetical protein